MEEIIAEIRQRYPECAITLSIGEKPAKAYERYFMKGADRYLLRHETFNRGHYYCLHPYEMSNEDVSNAFRNSNESVSRPGQASWWEPLTKEWNF